MKLRVTWMVAALAAGSVVAVSASSCKSGTPAPVAVGGGCTLNSDCDDPLVCLFQICHQECQSDRDCTDPVGSICVNVTGGSVCETPKEQSCEDGGTCSVQGTVCNSTDHVCRQQCTASSQCAGNDACYEGECYCQENCDSTNTLPDGAVVEAGPEASGSSSGGNEAGGSDAPSDVFVGNGTPLGYNPSNFGNASIPDGGIPPTPEGGTSIVGSDGGIDWSVAPDVTVSGNCTNDACLPAPIVVTQSDGSTAHLYVMKTLTIDSSSVLAPNDAVPVIFAVLGAVDIQGTISVSGYQYIGYAGALTWGGPSAPQGPGGGGNGFTANYPSSGGGGGSFCGLGGTAGAPTGTAAVGGSVYGNATITPLAAGSGGGYADGNQWGAGGGAIQISSGASILVRSVGIITAGGGSAYGGGGSGGTILLEAPSIDIQGNVTANGGGGGGFSTSASSGYGTGGQSNGQAAPGGSNSAGAMLGGAGSSSSSVNGQPGNAGDAAGDYGGGGGGAGWIRFNSASGSATVTGTISPALTTTCASQGTIH